MCNQAGGKCNSTSELQAPQISYITTKGLCICIQTHKRRLHSYTMAQNKAAWILESKGHPLKVEHADSPIPESGEIVVKNHAVAICPADNLVQSLGMFIERFPNIPGGDVAGEVVAVGSNVKGFKEGDRVMGCVS